MKRFITYVYVYENGVKGKNAGFIKAELRDGRVRMEIQLRGLGRYQGKVDMDLIVPAREKDGGIRLPFGAVEFHHGMANAYLEDSETQIAKSNYDFQQVAGVRMELDETHYLASCWVENAEHYVCHSRTVRNQNLERQSDGTNSADCVRNRECKSEKGENTSPGVVQKVRRQIPECNSEKIENISPTIVQKVQQQIPECNSEKIENISPTIVQKVQQQILENKQQMCEQTEEKQSSVGKNATVSVTLRKIDISDIHKFPKQNWYLCNNSFLIHGFFNYHHLMVKKVTENSKTKYYLGVPGVYDKPERMMALLFGFPEFEAGQQEADRDNGKPQKQVDCQAVNQSKEETQTTGSFGYWYCLLDM